MIFKFSLKNYPHMVVFHTSTVKIIFSANFDSFSSSPKLSCAVSQHWVNVNGRNLAHQSAFLVTTSALNFIQFSSAVNELQKTGLLGQQPNNCLDFERPYFAQDANAHDFITFSESSFSCGSNGASHICETRWMWEKNSFE